jgi:hypothetical protein
MNAQYASKPNLNPDEPNLFGLARIGGRMRMGNQKARRNPARRKRAAMQKIQSVKIGGICGSVCFTKTNPIFSRPNMHYQYQKPRNGGQKPTQKNETNPILTKA